MLRVSAFCFRIFFETKPAKNRGRHEGGAGTVRGEQPTAQRRGRRPSSEAPGPHARRERPGELPTRAYTVWPSPHKKLKRVPRQIIQYLSGREGVSFCSVSSAVRPYGQVP